MKKHKSIFNIVFFAPALLIAACNESSFPNEISSKETISVESSSIETITEPSNSEEIKIYNFNIETASVVLDNKFNKKFTIDPLTTLNGSSCNKGTLTYNSSNENVATVSENGTINYVGGGRCKIEAKWTVNSQELIDSIVVDCYEEVTLKKINKFSNEYLTAQGRVKSSLSGLQLSNTASGFDLGVKGTELKINAKGVATTLYLHVYIDDYAEGSLIAISTSEKEYTIFEGLEDSFHKVRIIKASSSQYGTITITKFVSEVTYFKAPLKDLSIEFLGDSISCGYGNLGTSGQKASSSNQDAGKAFPYLTAYNPSSYDANIVVIGLGENDMWHATDAQFSYTVDQFKIDYSNLIKLVRSYHPNSHIVCIYGMMSASSTTQANQTIQEAIILSQDTNISSLKVKMNTGGCETHPNVLGHQYFAKSLVSKIKENILK